MKKNKPNKSAHTQQSPSANEMSQVESAYRKEVVKYEDTLDVTAHLSQIQHGIKTDGRGIRAVKIFTRQTLIGISLKHILPLSQPISGCEVWDVCSVASLTRNLMEGYVTLFYAGTEKITPNEAELRFLLSQYHRNREWRDIRLKTNIADMSISSLNEVLTAQMLSLKAHPYFQLLSPDQRAKVIKGQEMYLSKADIEKRAPVVGQYRLHYQLLSNLVHPLPLSIERIGNDRGRGEKSDHDMYYCLICISLATKFLAASTVAIADLFPTQ